MSSWVPLRTAPPEPLCLPSTSYAIVGKSTCGAWSRVRRSGGQLCRGKSLQRICCRALEALQSYHNMYKLIHQTGRTTESSLPPDATSSQQQHHQRRKARSRAQPKTSRPGTVSPSPSPSPEPQDTLLHKLLPVNSAAASTIFNSARAPSSTPPSSSPSPNLTTSSGNNNNSSSSPTLEVFDPETEDLRPYIPHTVSLPYWQPPPTSLQHRTALTRAITNCPTYTRLHQLIQENAADFNCYHTCAALSRVLALHGAGLTPRESRLFKEGCSTLQTILRRQVLELQPRALVVVAYSLARLELPDRELLCGLAAAVEPHLSALQPQGLSSLLWAFARQNHQPPPKWMDTLLSAAAADLSAFGPRDMATLLWALARLHYKVAPARLKQLLDHAQLTMGSYTGRSLSNVVYSLGLSQQHPGGDWLEAAQRRAVELGPEAFTPQGITQMSWGIAKLGSTPSPTFLGLVLEHASQRLPLSPQERLQQEKELLLLQQQQQQQQRGEAGGGSSSDVEEARSSSDGLRLQQRRRRERYSGLDLATLMYSLASQGAQPRADLGRRLLAAVQWELPTLEANGMCNCLWACARLRLFPTKMWLSAFFDASYRQLPYFKPVDLSQTLWALARLQAAPPSVWMFSVMTRLQHSASMFSPVEVATTMWALARLGVRGKQMPGEVLALFFIATDRRLSSFKPQELCSMILALAHMRRRPDKEWTAEFLKVTYHRLASMSGWCLATVAWSLAELSLMPPPAWIYSYVNAARALMNVPAPPAAAAAPLQGEGAEYESATATTAATGLSAIDLGQIITALRRLNGGGSGGGLAKVDEFLREAEQRLAAMEVGSGAYAKQQLGAFLAMSPEQTGQSGAAAMLAPPMVSEPDGSYGSGGNDLGDRELATDAELSGAGGVGGGGGGGGRAGVKGPRVNRRRQRRAAALDLDQAQLLYHGERRRGRGLGGQARKRVGAAAAVAKVGRGGEAIAGGDNASGQEGVPVVAGASSTRSELGVAVAAVEGAASAKAAAAAASSANGRSPSCEVTRVLNGGARVTLAVPSPDVHVDLGGKLNVELSALPSGPVLWRPAAAAPGVAGPVGAAGNGDGNGNGNGVNGSRGGASIEGERADGGSGDDVASSTAEIKRRLLAV